MFLIVSSRLAALIQLDPDTLESHNPFMIDDDAARERANAKRALHLTSRSLSESLQILGASVSCADDTTLASSYSTNFFTVSS